MCCHLAISDANVPYAFCNALVFGEFDLVNLHFPVHQLVHVGHNARAVDVHQHEARSHVVGDTAAGNTRRTSVQPLWREEELGVSPQVQCAGQKRTC